MNISQTHLSASDMFGKKIIARKAICTLDNGYKYQATFYLPPPMKGEFQEETERKLVEAFNKSQPNMVHKLKKVHLMRN